MNNLDHSRIIGQRVTVVFENGTRINAEILENLTGDRHRVRNVYTGRVSVQPAKIVHYFA